MVVLQIFQAKCLRTALHHQHLHFGIVWAQKPPLAPLSCNLLLLFLCLLFYLVLFFFLLLLLFSLQLLLLMVNLPQQVVDEDRTPQVGLGVLQEPQLFQGQLQNAAPVLLQYQVLCANKKAEDQCLILHFSLPIKRKEESNIPILISLNTSSIQNLKEVMATSWTKKE